MLDARQLKLDGQGKSALVRSRHKPLVNGAVCAKVFIEVCPGVSKINQEHNSEELECRKLEVSNGVEEIDETIAEKSCLKGQVAQ